VSWRVWSCVFGFILWRVCEDVLYLNEFLSYDVRAVVGGVSEFGFVFWIVALILGIIEVIWEHFR